MKRKIKTLGKKGTVSKKDIENAVRKVREKSTSTLNGMNKL